MHDNLLEVTRKRKVYYGYYRSPLTLPHPVIRLGGKYLEDFGFIIGDTIEVNLTENQIIIKKISDTVPKPISNI